MLKRTLLLIALVFVSGAVNAQLNLTLAAQYAYPGSRGDCSDIWGYVDQTGNEYAIVGNQTGVSIMDVTIPTAPVEVFYSAGAGTIWRDIKVWDNTAYITNEGSGGMKIIDLSNLPGPITGADVSTFTGSTYPFNSAHNIFIDENGKGYIVGADNGVGGAIILDLATDPLNPTELGRYNDYYLHDLFVRGDTLWGGAINDGFFVVVDVQNPAACVTMATHDTPSTFTHNTWLSDDGNTLFTTDEVSDAYIAAYDVSDLLNIVELDRIQSSPGNNVIPHNTFVLGDYLITSYYRDGITIHDASNPSNLIEVGNYDTAPSMSGDGFNGCWGVYPYLPSGNLIASDIEEGLFVFNPNYVSGAYLEGNVTDLVTTNPIDNAQIDIVTTSISANTNAAGDYFSGVGSGGTFDVTFSKLGYVSETVTGVVLTNGVTTVVDVALQPLVTFTLQGLVIDENSNPIPNAIVNISNSQFTTTTTTNGIGEFDVPSFLEDTYDVTIGLWGYHTLCLPNQTLDIAGSPYTYQLETGYSDYFDIDLGWSVSGNPGTGDWERGVPVGTDYQGTESNPGYDSQDCGEMAYVTGNGGGGAGSDDIDDGETVLNSPLMDLSTYENPYISFDRWFFNDGGSFGQPNDSLVVELSNGTVSAIIDFSTTVDPASSSWSSKKIRVTDYMAATSFMQVKVRAMDLPAGHLVEGGFDNFVVSDSSLLSITDLSPVTGIKFFPVPFQEELNIQLDATSNAFETITVEVYELSSGRIVDVLEFANSNTIAINNNYAKGMYMIRVYGDDAILTTRRVVKM